MRSEMRWLRPLWLLMMLIFTTDLGISGDIAHVFGDDGPQPLDYALIEVYNETEPLVFCNTAGPGVSGEGEVRTIQNLREELNGKVDITDPSTRETAVVLAAKYPGDRTIDQICSIYEYLKQGWKYVSDPTGIDYYQSASESIRIGERADCAGAGDCDDFAILMSALIESIGGTARIVLAYNQSDGHAYTEVYLGRLGQDQVEQIVEWLKQKYDVGQIYVHVDSDTSEVWLNLDWSSVHPGGPFYKAEKQIVLVVRSELRKVPLNVNVSTTTSPNSPPELADFISDKNSPQIAGSTIEFIASASDPDKDTIYYRFLLKGPIPSEEMKLMQEWGTKNYWSWMPSQEGNYTIVVWIRDGQHAAPDSYDSFKEVEFNVNSPSETNQPPVVNSLQTGVGTNVVWFSADATDPDSDPIYYKFYVKGPCTSYRWEAVEDWSTKNEAQWLAFQLGQYVLQVWVRDGLHAGPDSYDSFKAENFTVIEHSGVSSDEEWAARGSGIRGRPA